MTVRIPMPTTGIKMSDIRDTLGESSTVLSVLHKSDNVNIFAYYKPVIENSNPAEWFKGEVGDFGINIPSLLDFDDIQVANWTRKKATGGAAEPYKMGHFRGYLHTADFMIHVTVDTLTSINLIKDTSYTFLLQLSDRNGDNVILSDMQTRGQAVEDCYLGCVAIGDQGTEYWFTSSARIGTEPSITINWNDQPWSFPEFKDGTTQFKFFASRSFKAVLSPPPGDLTRYALPYLTGTHDLKKSIRTFVQLNMNVVCTGVRDEVDSGTWRDPATTAYSDTVTGAASYRFNLNMYDGTSFTLSSSPGIGYSCGIRDGWWPTDIFDDYVPLYNTSGQAISSITVPSSGAVVTVVISNNWLVRDEPPGTRGFPSRLTQTPSTCQLQVSLQGLQIISCAEVWRYTGFLGLDFSDPNNSQYINVI